MPNSRSLKRTVVVAAAKSIAKKAGYAILSSSAGVVFGLILCLVVVIVGVAALVITRQQDCTPDSSAALNGTSLRGSRLTSKHGVMNSDQLANAELIVRETFKRRQEFSGAQLERVTTTALAAANVESRFRNVPVGKGDLDSGGLFQMRPSMGWGSKNQVEDPVYSINKFLDVLKGVPGWRTLPPEILAQRVERSGVPDAYGKYLDEAKAIYSKMVSGTSVSRTQDIVAVDPSVSTAGCDTGDDTLDKAIQAAIASSGQHQPGAQMVAAAFDSVGVNLPNTISGLSTYKGNSSNVTAKVIPGTTDLERGDVLLLADKPGGTILDATRAGIFEGSSLGNLRIATQNVLGASHTAKGRRNNAASRITRAADLIKSNNFTVVGLQELQKPQRPLLMKRLGPDWQIFPSQPTYLRAARPPAIDSANSIIWDSTKVQFVSGSALPLPLYFDGSPKNIPLVKLRHLDSGQEFYVANTHDAAGSAYPKFRWNSARQHAADAERLALSGLPVIFTGDFNSGYGLRHGNTNVTYQNKRENLTWCVMTKSGVLVNAYDASRTPARSGCPEATTREKGVGPVDHIYVSRNVKVNHYQVIDGNTGSDHPVVFADVGNDAINAASTRGSLGTMIAPKAGTGVVAELPVSKSQIVGVIRLTISDVSGVGSSIAADGKWVLPVAMPYVKTAHFNEAGAHWSHNHTGQDFADPTGTPIRAATNGVIKETGWAGAYGNRTVERLGDGSELWYCHQSYIGVKPGQAVKAGQVIGKIGATGNVTGPHLHFEVRTPNGTAIDPMPVLRKNGLNP